MIFRFSEFKDGRLSQHAVFIFDKNVQSLNLFTPVLSFYLCTFGPPDWFCSDFCDSVTD